MKLLAVLSGFVTVVAAAVVLHALLRSPWSSTYGSRDALAAILVGTVSSVALAVSLYAPWLRKPDR